MTVVAVKVMVFKNDLMLISKIRTKNYDIFRLASSSEYALRNIINSEVYIMKTTQVCMIFVLISLSFY